MKLYILLVIEIILTQIYLNNRIGKFKLKIKKK